MKKETKQYKYLKKLIGKEIIRIKPCECSYGIDYSYTTQPVRVMSVSKEEFVFEKDFGLRKNDANWMKEWLDGNWYSVEDAKRFPKTKLNELQGKMIRSKSDHFSSGYVSSSFLDEPVKLIMATKYHLLLDWNGRELWLGNRQTDPNDWQKV